MVMPSVDLFCLRWGPLVQFPWPTRLREVLTIMLSLLKGFNFLHEHNITHRDINQGNFLVNHFGDDLDLWDNKVRIDLRSRESFSYVIFDFDNSIKLPSALARTQCRLPYQESWGTFNDIADTHQGEYDFNPFVLDVGALGVALDRSFQHFTASEALAFFEEMVSQLSDVELDQPIEPKDFNNPQDLDEYNRWAHGTPKFARRWAHYREPPIPWTTSLLRRICCTSWGCHTVSWIRWFLSRLSFFFLRVLSHPSGLKPMNP
ncbi:hypothetical protein CVT25_011429 [Psilocybe cyanescens]|uniref:Protein kinase domain-containing protein n=1 Tax=Psilocybe cyanescens TaxID=93625 RepID=A0A409XV14_PSICY|nr:hypothetical protein CVT25_011429 [Psilocybe cyanescens]